MKKTLNIVKTSKFLSYIVFVYFIIKVEQYYSEIKVLVGESFYVR